MDPAKSEIILSGNFQVAYLAQIGLQTRDRLGTAVHVSDMKVVLKGTFTGKKKPKPFGSAPVEVPEGEKLRDVIQVSDQQKGEEKQDAIIAGMNANYKATVQGNKDKYAAITMMKVRNDIVYVYACCSDIYVLLEHSPFLRVRSRFVVGG